MAEQDAAATGPDAVRRAIAGRTAVKKAMAKVVTVEDTPFDPSTVPGQKRKRKPSGGYSVEVMNREYALVLMGSKAVVVREQNVGPIEDRLRVLTLDAFRAKFLNRKFEVMIDGKRRSITYANAWLSDLRRRDYDGIEFRPDPGEAAGTPRYLNLWRGFGVPPKAKKDGYSIFEDHLRNNVCAGSDELYRWLFGWFAHVVQRPRERPGTALVFRGKMGTGKTKIGEVFGSLFPSHYFMVDDPRYVTGQFNAHMAACLLLQAEEAVWAGDKAAEGRLKGLVSSKFQMIEAKGVDPIRLDNYVRLIMTSNEDWVVPAGKDERRFCVLDVDPRCAQNHDYFREMDEELADGGREALLHDLLNFDLASVDLWSIPRTGALLEQKLRSLDTVESWWFERLVAGVPTNKADSWPETIPVDTLHDDYLAIAEKIGVRRKSEATAFGMKLRKLLPGLRCVRRMNYGTGGMPTGRLRHYELPPLIECRQLFEDALSQPIDWEDMSEREGERD